MASNFYTDIDLHSNGLKNVKDGALATDGINKGQLDAAVAAIDLTGYATDAEMSAEVTARGDADTALGARLDAIALTGDGFITATESGDNQWALALDSIPLADTYVGPGTDSATINADLAAQAPPVVAEAGDLYINDTLGTTYINTGLAAPNDWTQLATAAAGVNAIAAVANETAVTNPTGPTATIGLATAFKDRITALEAVSHAKATGANAITVDDATQAIALLLDPAGATEVTQSASGLKVDLSTYAKTADVHAAATGTTPVVVDPTTQAVSLEAAFVTKVNSAPKVFTGPAELVAATPLVVTHNLALTGGASVQVWVGGSPVGVDVSALSANSVTLTSSANLTASVTVSGL